MSVTKFEPPNKLGEWDVEHKIGNGGCGRVYRAKRDGVTGAIKVVKQRSMVLPHKEINFAAMLDKETLCLNELERVQSPYLPQLYHPFTKSNDEWYFYVMELFPGGTLHDFVKNQQAPLSSSLVCAIGWRLLKCLQAIHEAGWFHLDVKPTNIVISDDPARGIALIDFGLSLPHRYTVLCPRTGINGAFQFVASSVWRLERESPRDDLEALGFTMAWALLGGKLPWTEDSHDIIERKIKSTRLPSVLGRKCKNMWIDTYLSSVRKLGVNDVPDYKQLLDLLAKEAGDELEVLNWPRNPAKRTRIADD